MDVRHEGRDCGTLPDARWSHVTAWLGPTHVFTVKINGVAQPACTNAFGMQDPSNAGYGGVTDWDDFYVQ